MRDPQLQRAPRQRLGTPVVLEVAGLAPPLQIQRRQPGPVGGAHGIGGHAAHEERDVGVAAAGVFRPGERDGGRGAGGGSRPHRTDCRDGSRRKQNRNHNLTWIHRGPSGPGSGRSRGPRVNPRLGLGP